MISQFAMSKAGRGGRRTLPFAFTEHGALMAATVLNSPRAVAMTVYIIRAFVKLREVALPCPTSRQQLFPPFALLSNPGLLIMR